ncbi:SGNH/GDSL hydrolase family protein [Chloroflexota bacterium]
MLPIILALLSIALAASIVSNFITFNRGRQYYLQLNGTRLDPLGLSAYPPEANQDLPANSDQVRVVFFGDSRAYQWTFPSGLEQFQFINRGIGSQTSVQVVERFDEHVAPLQPQVIIVQVCINDLKTIPLFPDKKEAIVANCQANIEKITSASLDLGATVILTSIFPLGEIPLERRPFWSADVAEASKEVNAFMHALAADNVVIFDTTAILADERGIVQKQYSQDFLHLSETGYEALNNELVDILVSLEKR